MSRWEPGRHGNWDVGNAQFHETHGSLSVSDPGWAASTGLVHDEMIWLQFGHNEDIDTAAVEEINDFGGAMTHLTTASTFDVVSDSSADDLTTGTGAWEITIRYLDANYELQAETISLDGLTPVTTTGSGLRILSAYIGRVGTGGVNAGNIAITATTGGTTQGLIEAGQGQTHNINFTVPAGYTAFFLSGVFSVSETSGGALKETTAEFEAYVRLYNELSTNNYNGWRDLFQVHLNNRGTGAQYIRQDVHNPIPEKTDMKLTARVGANDTQVTARLFILLRKN